jgi:hypothetical protein
VGFTWIPHGRLLAAVMLTRPTPGLLRDLLREPVSAKSSTFGSGIVFDVSASVRIGASADSSCCQTGGLGEIARKKRAGRVDRRLHLLFSDVPDVQIEHELQRDHRGAVGARGRHLVPDRAGRTGARAAT